jgi:hypothetical protein
MKMEHNIGYGKRWRVYIFHSRRGRSARCLSPRSRSSAALRRSIRNRFSSCIASVRRRSPSPFPSWPAEWGRWQESIPKGFYELNIPPTHFVLNTFENHGRMAFPTSNPYAAFPSFPILRARTYVRVQFETQTATLKKKDSKNTEK